MNRIVLIGNGFDLAHRLKTGYKDFIDDFWRGEVEKMREVSNKLSYEDEYISLITNIHNLEWIIKRGSSVNNFSALDTVITKASKSAEIVANERLLRTIENVNIDITEEEEGLKDMKRRKEKEKLAKFKLAESQARAIERGEYVEIVDDIQSSESEESKNALRSLAYVEFTIKNKFLEYITRHSALHNWVDIEETYHRFLCGFYKKETMALKGKSYAYDSVETLHKDFNNVKKALEKYLTKIEKEEVRTIDEVKEHITSEFNFRDFTSKGKNIIVEEEYHRLKTIDSPLYKNIKKELFPRFNDMSEKEIKSQLKENLSSHYKSQNLYRLFLDKKLFLNFNYTNLEESYVNYQLGDDVIHIHGELNNPANPIIFGYGDEIGEEYKELEKLNDNEYLENIKSIKYLETGNYKRLLSFIDSEPYQVFILGHSCGNSDRTLLNTLFEHENCTSIKLYYHPKDEHEDNYSDVIRNISRNFNDKASMREKVVNKEYCNSLTPYNNKQSQN